MPILGYDLQQEQQLSHMRYYVGRGEKNALRGGTFFCLHENVPEKIQLFLRKNHLSMTTLLRKRQWFGD